MGNDKSDRRAGRVKRRVNVSFKVGEKSYRGIAMQFSEFGMFIQARQRLKAATPVTIHLPVSPQQEVSLRGRVVSAREQVSMAIGGTAGGIGIALESPPEEYSTFLLAMRG